METEHLIDTMKRGYCSRYKKTKKTEEMNAFQFRHIS